MSHPNPYAPPLAHVDDVSAGTSYSEQIRQEHIKHEASVRSIGTLYYIGGVFMGLAGIGFILAGVFMQAEEMATGAIGVVYALLSALSLVVGRGVRRLLPWARTTAIVLACIGLLGFPLGTLLNGYILYLLLSTKGKRIFETDYPQIVADTPHIKYKTSIVVWIVLAIIVAGVAAAIIIPALSR